MKNQFSIGQMAVMQHGTYHTEHDGQLAIITGALAVRRALNASTMTHENTVCYEIRVLCTPSRTLLAKQYQLRPLHDPRAGTGQVRCDALGRPIRRYLRIKGPDGKAVVGRELTPDEVRIVEADIERWLEEALSQDRHSDGKS
jgi:hypothetical protein